MFFEYGKKELNYLCANEPKFANVIEKIGVIKREMQPDFIKGIVFQIISQQIQTKAANTIYEKLEKSWAQ